MTKDKAGLPKGFDDLNQYVTAWALPTEGERIRQRQRSTIEELREFYQAALSHAPAALELLGTVSLDKLAGKERNLFLLFLSFAEVAPAVELFGRVQEEGVYDIFRVTAVHDHPL